LLGKILRSSIVSIVAATFILVVIHLVPFVEASGFLGVLRDHLTLYYGQALDIYTLVTWLLVINPSAMRLANYLSVLFAWTIAWYISGEWVRDKIAVSISSVIAMFFLILYLAAWRHASIVLYLPESLTIIYGAVLAGVFLTIKEKVARKPTFFELLEREGYKVTDIEKKGLDLPSRCSKCNAVIYGSSTYCWRCSERIL